MVTFNPVVEVREMSIDRSAHEQEVKNPVNIMEVVPDVVAAPAAPADATRWWPMLIIIVVLILAFTIHRAKTSKKLSKVTSIDQYNNAAHGGTHKGVYE